MASMAEADRRAALMLGKPIDNHNRYLTVALTDCHKKMHPINPVVSKARKRNMQKQWSRVRNTKCLQGKANVANMSVIPSLKLDVERNETLKETDVAKVLVAPLTESDNSGQGRLYLSSSTNYSSGSETAYSTDVQMIINLVCKPDIITNLNCQNTSQTSPKKMKKNCKTANKNILNTSKSCSSNGNAESIECLSSNVHSKRPEAHVTPTKRRIQVASSNSSNLGHGDIDEADCSIIDPEMPSPTISHSSSVVLLDNSSPCKNPEVAADNVLDSSVEIIKMPIKLEVKDDEVTYQANTIKISHSPSTSAVVPPASPPKPTETINSLKSFRKFKRKFPQFGKAIEEYEIFLQNGAFKTNGTGNVAKNIFSVLSYFVHKNGPSNDFSWDFVCWNLEQIIPCYITNHSDMMPIKALKKHVLKAFCRLSSYLHLLNLSPKTRFLPFFSEATFNEMVLNSVQKISENSVATESPTKQKMEVVKTSASLRSDTAGQEVVEPPKLESSPKTTNKRAKYRTKASLKTEFAKFKKKFPNFASKLEEYKIYWDNNSARSSADTDSAPNIIFSVMSSFVETCVVKDFDWKFVCINIHNIVEHVCIMNFGSKKINGIRRVQFLKAFLKLSSYLQHLQSFTQSNFLPFFSFDIFNNVLMTALKKTPNKRSVPSRKLKLSPSLLEDDDFNLHKMAEVFDSSYVRNTIDGVLAFGLAKEHFAFRVSLIGLAELPSDREPLVPSHETACRVQSVLMLLGCLRNGCRSSKLSSLNLEDFSKPVWIDSHSALFRSTAHEEAHSHPSYVWWTSTEMRVLQYYLLHYRQHICGCTDKNSPLFPSPSCSSKSVGIASKSAEVKSMFQTVLREVGSRFKASWIWSHQLRYAYFFEMKESGLSEDSMSELAWTLGYSETYSMLTGRIRDFRKIVKRSRERVEKHMTSLLCYSQNRMLKKSLAEEDNAFDSTFVEIFPLICKRKMLLATQECVLAHLKLPFLLMLGDGEKLMTKSQLQQMKSSRTKEKVCGKKRKRSGHEDIELAYDETKRQAVIDWLVKIH